MTNFPDKPAWMHVAVLSLVYGVIVFMACCLTDQTEFVSFYATYTILGPFLLILGCWAATGPGNLMTRLPAISLLGPLLVVAAYLGLSTNSDYRFIIDSSDDFWGSLVVVFIVSFASCVGCQFPFWMLRFVFGWRLVSKDSPHAFERNGSSISELFLLTAVFAIALSVPQTAMSILFEFSIRKVEVGETQYFSPSEVDSNLEYGSIKITEENVAPLRKRRRQEYEGLRSIYYRVILIYCGILAVIGLYFSPAIWFCLRFRGERTSVVSAAVYLLVAFMILAMLILYFSSSKPRWLLAIPYLFFYSIAVSVAGIIPLLVSRQLGIRLVTRRDVRRHQAAQKLTATE